MNLLTSIDTHPGKSVDHPCAALALCLTLIFLASPLQAFDINHADGAFLVTITGGEDEETRLSSYLDRENIEHRVRTAESRESLGFIVVTEPFTDRLAATPMLGKLRDAGIRDFLFVGRGDYENRISIGVFSTRESADQRADQVNARGFDFSVIQRFRTVRGREIVIRDSEITGSALLRILNGEPGTMPESVALDPVIAESSSPAQDSATAHDDNIPAVTQPKIIPVEPVEAVDPVDPVDTADKEESSPDRAVSTPPVVTSSRQAAGKDSQDWTLLLAVLALLAIAALGVILFRRNRPVESADAQVAEPATVADTGIPSPNAAPAPDAVTASRTSPGDAEPASTGQIIRDYAESVLEGRPGSSISRDLTILGTDDHKVANLIQDLLFLGRLQDRTTALEDFAFDSSSLIDSLISRLTVDPDTRSKKAMVTVKSVVPEDLPASISMDGHKLNRVMTILLQYAISRTHSGQISVAQRFDRAQLTIEIRFHPEGAGVNEELETIVNPMRRASRLDINERVKFGIANRLATVMGGRVDARLEMDEALITLRCPATEQRPPQLALPSGKTIDDLLNAEAEARAAADQASKEAEDKIAAANARINDIEQNAARSIQVLQEELAGIEDASRENSRQLEERATEIKRLQEELNAARSARDERLQQLETERQQVIAELEKAGETLNSTRSSLEQEIASRADSEQEALARASELEAELTAAREQHEAALSTFNQREKQANASVEELKRQVGNLESALETGESSASEQLDQLKTELREAEEKAAIESVQREQAETSAREQVTRLMESLETTRETLRQAAEDKAQLEARLQASQEEIESIRTQLGHRAEEAQREASTARTEMEQLKQELAEANNALAIEQAAKSAAEDEAAVKLAELEAQVEAATLARDEARQLQEERIRDTSATIDRLNDELAQAQEQLSQQDDNAEDQDQRLRIEMQELRTQLRGAQERLDLEVSRRNSAESAAGSQISELLDELNQLRAENQSANILAENQEKERLAQIEAISIRLAQSEQALELERATRSEIEETSLRHIQEMEAQLKLMELDHEKLKAQVERSNAFGQRQTDLLEEALADADNAAKLGNAARKVTQHLRAKIKRLELQLAEQEQHADAAQVPLLTSTQAVEASPFELPSEPVLDIEQAESGLADTAGESRPTPAPAGGFEDDFDEADFSLEDFSDEDEEHPVQLEGDAAASPEIELLEETDEETGDTAAATALTLSPLETGDDSSTGPAWTIDGMDDDASTAVATSRLSMEPLEDDTITAVPAPSIEPLTKDRTTAAPALSMEPTAGKPETGSDRDTGPAAASKAVFNLPEALDALADSEEDEEEVEFQFDDKPIRSSRPVNNPILHAMIERFVDRLNDEIEKMELSLAKRDYLELVVSCNWIRGEANTLGFEALNQPVQSIELQLRRRKFSQIITHLSELRNMAERIDIKRVKTGDAPVQYVVPASANNTAIYENFVSQLGTKLLEMELALGDENIRQIGQLCRWVERYSEKIRFLEVMDAAKQLRQAIDADNIDDITGILKNFVALYSKIEIVREQTAS